MPCEWAGGKPIELLHVGRGWDSEFAAGRLPEQSVVLAWMMVGPSGQFTRWPESRVRRWWLRRRGWVFYDGNGHRRG